MPLTASKSAQNTVHKTKANRTPTKRKKSETEIREHACHTPDTCVVRLAQETKGTTYTCKHDKGFFCKPDREWRRTELGQELGTFGGGFLSLGRRGFVVASGGGNLAVGGGRAVAIGNDVVCHLGRLVPFVVPWHLRRHSHAAGADNWVV